MTNKDNKLAEEIYFDLCDRFIDTISREQIVFMAMQAYHEAKMREEKTIISFITKLIKNESIPII